MAESPRAAVDHTEEHTDLGKGATGSVSSATIIVGSLASSRYSDCSCHSIFGCVNTVC